MSSTKAPKIITRVETVGEGRIVRLPKRAIRQQVTARSYLAVCAAMERSGKRR